MHRLYGDYGPYVTGRDDDVLVTMTAHHTSFEVNYFHGKVMVGFGGHCDIHLTIDQAIGLRALLDAGIADGLAESVAAGPMSLVDKAVTP